MARTWIASGLVTTVLIFVSQTLAKPQSDNDQLKEIRAEYSTYPGADSVSDYTEDGGSGSFPPNASVPFQRTISRSRRSKTSSDWFFNRTFLEQAGFAEWASGKPRDGEKCGAVTPDGKLSSVDCDKEYAFVCEVPRLNNVAGSGFQNSVQRDGQRESPAKTCKDLFVAYPDMPSDEYWIDPNEGDVSDAILVYCDAEERVTCFTPESSRSPNISYTGHEREVWLNEIDDGFQITYPVAPNQINALQLLSRHAEQGVTYRCMKSVGYFDTKNQNTERGLKLLAWNDFKIQPTGNRLFRYDVISDGYQDRLDEWKETVITYRTNQPARLPVLDVGLRDVGKPGQQFSVEIGKVCFN